MLTEKTTPVLHRIGNEFLTVTASEQGAELWSLKGRDGTEYLWQGDRTYWTDRAPNLFPYVARLTEGSYWLDGKRWHMDIHGLAPYCRFQLAEKSDRHMTFLLTDSPDTRVCYPRRFAFRVCYALEEQRLKITYTVENRDEKTMYFGLGGHPGFRVPLREGKCFTDYRLRFSHPCSPVRVGFTPDCFRSGRDEPFPLEEGRFLPLRHDLFDDDAIVLSQADREVTLEAEGDSRSITVSCPQMPYLGLWHMPGTDAPYVCIEPWVSLPSEQGKVAVFEEQPDLITLEPGGQYENCWSISVSG